MTYNYLHLVNRLCNKLNEVPLDSSNFSTAGGVYADFKHAVNAAIRDICAQHDNEWPFLWQKLTFSTTIGQHEYTKDASAVNIDWDSFYVKKPQLTITSLTQTAGLATATVSAGHQLVTGDSVYISGADQSQYNGNFTATVTSPTDFTFSVDPLAISPATGTITMYPPYTTQKLTLIDYDKYRQEGELERDLDSYEASQYQKPRVIVRQPNNDFILSPKADRVYTVSYESFVKPVSLALHSDVPIIPENFEDVIVDGAIVHGYFFRDNIEQTTKAENSYQDKLNDMRRILIPMQSYMRIVY
jgi:hypothetical protein